MVTEINRQGFLQFLVSLCAIIGGLVTVMRYALSFSVVVSTFVVASESNTYL